MKKLRGKKRYYRNLFTRAADYNVRLTDDSWFDLWHTHLDWFGIGDQGMKPRKQHISALFELHSNLLNQLQSFSKPYQIWMTIHERDSGQDAVFIHSPNMNRENFPLHFNHAIWNCPVPEILYGIIDLNRYEIGFCNSDFTDEKIYFVHLKNAGIPFVYNLMI